MSIDRLLKFRRELRAARAAQPSYTGTGFLWKYFFQWKKHLNSSSVEARLPWLTYPAIDLLNAYVKPGMRVFEYGGGGSTLFFTDRQAHVFTVEHDKGWFEALSKNVRHPELWKGLYIAPETCDQPGDAADPDAYASTDEASLHFTFKAYAQAIDAYEPMDIVLVDGRSRPSCMKHGMAKLKQGGLLVLDNSDRSYYTTHLQSTLDREYTLLLDATAPVPFMAWFSRTTIWKKR